MAIVEEPFSILRWLRLQRTRTGKPPLTDATAEEQAAMVARNVARDGGEEEEELADAASLGDPSILRAYNYTVTRATVTEDGYLWVEHLLICNRCFGGDMFSIGFAPKAAPDPSPYAGVSPGEIARLRPWTTRCVGCGHEEVLVSSALGAPDPAPAKEELLPYGTPEETGAATVFVSLVYPADAEDLDDLKEEAARAGVSPADLFTAIHVRGCAPNFETIFDGWLVLPAPADGEEPQ